MKIAHITTIDVAIRVLLLNQLKSLQEVPFEVYGISAPGPNVPAIEAAGIKHIAVPMIDVFGFAESLEKRIVLSVGCKLNGIPADFLDR